MRQTKYIVMMTKEGSTKIVNFMTPEAGVFVLGCGHIYSQVSVVTVESCHALFC